MRRGTQLVVALAALVSFGCGGPLDKPDGGPDIGSCTIIPVQPKLLLI